MAHVRDTQDEVRDKQFSDYFLVLTSQVVSQVLHLNLDCILKILEIELIISTIPLILLLLLTDLRHHTFLLCDPEAYLLIETELSPLPPRLSSRVPPPHDISNHEPLDLVHAPDLRLLPSIGLRPLPLPQVQMSLFLSETLQLSLFVSRLPIEVTVLGLDLLVLFFLSGGFFEKVRGHSEKVQLLKLLFVHVSI